ncbi:PIN domain-containing protein [Burkholderia sp. 3C]
MAKRLIIDTNLLLLLVIGAVEEGRHIRNSKRLGAFSLRDYDNVVKIMSEYEMVFITPYIATEVSNLIDLDGYARNLAYDFARNMFAVFFQNRNRHRRGLRVKFFLDVWNN